MPDPPDTSLISYALFDNPWPLALMCLAAAVAFLVAWRNTRRRGFVSVAAGLVLVAGLAFVLEQAVTTSGERAEAVTSQLVSLAEQSDVQGASALFSEDALMSLGSPRNPGLGIDTIRARLALLRNRYVIESNRITSLKAYSAGTDRGVVHLRITTTFAGGMGYSTPSAWVVEVSREPGSDQWKITHLTFVEYNLGQKPSISLF